MFSTRAFSSNRNCDLPRLLLGRLDNYTLTFCNFWPFIFVHLQHPLVDHPSIAQNKSFVIAKLTITPDRRSMDYLSKDRETQAFHLKEPRILKTMCHTMSGPPTLQPHLCVYATYTVTNRMVNLGTKA